MERFALAIVGAGFGGLAMAHRLTEAGIDDFVIFERADGVGGTWRSNSYPGAACDVPSHLYSLSFAPNPRWSRTYATQPEILAYIEDCYDRFAIRPKVRVSTSIVGLRWQEDTHSWRLTDASGTEYEAAVVVSAIGLFHTPAVPSLPGADDFGGVTFHSARWDHDHDLSGQRVAVIGTGASAIQVVPAIVDQVARLTVYQRTPPWIVPRKDETFSDSQKAAFATDPELVRRYRSELYELFERNTAFIAGDPAAVHIDSLARSYLRQKVTDAELRARLTPDHPVGSKRILVSSEFYPAIQRDTVELVTEPIEKVVSAGIVTADGTERAHDTVVYCTGFHVVEYLKGVEVLGRGGIDIHRVWAGVPRAYHGLAVPGFPNLFMMYGPNTNQGGNSIILVLEAQAQFVMSALDAMRSAGSSRIELRPEAMARYLVELDRALAATVWADGSGGYFRTASGDVVTQLPYTSGSYADRIEYIDPGDFDLGSPRAGSPQLRLGDLAGGQLR